MFSGGFSLVVYAVSAKEHRSEGMVGMERGVWFLGMKRQKLFKYQAYRLYYVL